MGSIGILRNSANIFPAAKFASDNVSIVTGGYFNGQAVRAFGPNSSMMDTREIPAGVLGGTYTIGFFYDSTTATENGTPLMRFELYENDVLMAEDTSAYVYGTVYQNDLNYLENIHNYGLFTNYNLDPNKSHRLVVKTSPLLSGDAILDYVIFEKVASNNIINGNPIAPRMGKRNMDSSSLNYFGGADNLEDYGTQLVMEQITGTMASTFAAGASGEYGWTYNTPFKTVIGAYPNIIDANNQLICNWSDWWPVYDQVQIKIKNISSSTWSKAVTDQTAWNYHNMRILVVGYI